MKRYICLCLTLLMSISILAGCTFTSVQVEPISEVGNSGISVASNEPVETVVDKENLPKVEEVKPDGENITVKFIDVGQADSCLIITPDKEAILIDAGENKDAEEIIPELEEEGIDNIDLMVLSHPHADHIGGAETLLNIFEVNEVVMCSYAATSKMFNSLLDTLDTKNILTTQAKIGLVYEIDGVKIEVLAVDTLPKDNNNSSIVCKVTYGDIDILFTGDCEEQSEKIMLDYDCDFESEILKVGHHGSETSTSEAFLDAVNPSLCVISVGEGNSYKHPSERTLSLFKNNGITYYRTDELGTIELEIDGKNIISNFTDNFETENSNSGRFLLEPAVAEVHLETEVKVLDKVSENNK